MDEDRETIARVLDGDYDAFEELVEKYEGRIYRHLRKMVKDNHHAQDLLQETFLSAYKGLGGFTGASSFSTWLFRIATNAALMYLRKQRPESVEYDDEIRSQTDGAFAAASQEFVNTPLDILLSSEGRRKIEEAIDDLPVLYRSVIVLRDVEGFSLEEVSKIMDSSVAAIKSRLHRARNSVREALTSYFMEKEAHPDRQRASQQKHG
jgi:RNA polymerase sigma-70 factor (ECF subfamily)